MNQAAYQFDTFAEDMLAVEAAAEHFSNISDSLVTARTVHRWINEGIRSGQLFLPAVKIGWRVCTSKQAINWFLHQRQLLDSRTAVANCPPAGDGLPASVDCEPVILGFGETPETVCRKLGLG